MAVIAEIYFDTRAFRTKTKDYPFKLRVYSKGSRKLYPTVYGLSQADQKKLDASRLGPELQKIKLDLKEIERTPMPPGIAVHHAISGVQVILCRVYPDNND